MLTADKIRITLGKPVVRILMGSDDGVQHSELLRFWTFSIVQYSKKLENTFRKLDLFPSSGQGERLGFVTRFLAKNLHLLLYISVSSGYALSQFLLFFFLLSPIDIAWSQVLLPRAPKPLVSFPPPTPRPAY
jgi:hypothetical protein